METVTPDQFAQARAAMISVCAGCHSSRFVQDSLEQADRIKDHGTRLISESARILEDLHRDGLLAPADGRELVLGGEQVRLSPSQPGAELLNRFYDMWRFHYAWTWKGAYHSSASVANLQSRPGLEADLNWIQSTAACLREQQQ